jgi:hypothetical protein
MRGGEHVAGHQRQLRHVHALIGTLTNSASPAHLSSCGCEQCRIDVIWIHRLDVGAQFAALQHHVVAVLAQLRATFRVRSRYQRHHNTHTSHLLLPLLRRQRRLRWRRAAVARVIKL